MSESSVPFHLVPERLLADTGPPRCRWIDVGGARYSDPFFDTTLSKRRWLHAASEISPLEEVCDRAAAAESVEPRAFIFHVSRCGSTLVTQLLGLDERAIVLSEPPILDEVLRSSLPERDTLFVATLRLLCRRRFATEERAFLKTESWHLFEAARLRRLFPDIPFVLLYRSPDAVLASHRRSRGMQMVPGLINGALAEIPHDPAHVTLDEYAAVVLERLYHAMLETAATDSNSLLVSYDEGFPDAFLRLSNWLGMALDAAALRQVRARCGYQAKTPQDPFDAEVAPPPGDVDLAPLWTLHAKLEDRRRQQAARAGRAVLSRAGRDQAPLAGGTALLRDERARLGSAPRPSQTRRASLPADATRREELTRRIVRFLLDVGILVEEHELPESTFLPGIAVRAGALRFDLAKLEYPGDLLHEAGHLAVLPPAERHSAAERLGDDGGDEMAAIAWSFAACVHLGIPLDVLFHADGYKGEAANLAENFRAGRYVGVPILEWRGMARAHGEPAYPAMIRWLCP